MATYEDLLARIEALEEETSLPMLLQRMGEFMHSVPLAYSNDQRVNRQNQWPIVYRVGDPEPLTDDDYAKELGDWMEAQDETMDSETLRERDDVDNGDSVDSGGASGIDAKLSAFLDDCAGLELDEDTSRYYASLVRPYFEEYEAEIERLKRRPVLLNNESMVRIHDCFTTWKEKRLKEAVNEMLDHISAQETEILDLRENFLAEQSDATELRKYLNVKAPHQLRDRIANLEGVNSELLKRAEEAESTAREEHAKRKKAEVERDELQRRFDERVKFLGEQENEIITLKTERDAMSECVEVLRDALVYVNGYVQRHCGGSSMCQDRTDRALAKLSDAQESEGE